MKNKKAITLIELIVGVSISMLLMLSIGIFTSSGISNLFLQEKNIGNNISINNFFTEAKKNLDNIEKSSEIIQNGVIFKRKTEFNDGGFSFIGTKQKTDFCENGAETKHIFLKNFIPGGLEIVEGNLKTSQKENSVFENGKKIIGTDFYGKQKLNGEIGEQVSLNGPTGIIEKDGKIFLSDTLNNRILVKKKNGKIYDFIGEEAGLKEPNGLFFDGDDFYIANSGNGEILKYSIKNEIPNYNKQFKTSGRKFNRIKFTYIKEIGEDEDYSAFEIEENDENKILEKVKKSELDKVELDEKTVFQISYLDDNGNQKIEEIDQTKYDSYKEKKEFQVLKIKKYFYLYTYSDQAGPNKKEIFDENKKNFIKNLTLKKELISAKKILFFDSEKNIFYLMEIEEKTDSKGNKKSVEKFFQIEYFYAGIMSFPDLPKFSGNFGKGRFFVELSLEKFDEGSSKYTKEFEEKTKIFFNDLRELKQVKNNLKYPYKINSTSDFVEFDMQNPGDFINFDENFDTMLEVPIKSLEVSKDGNFLNIIVKYYKNFDCENLDLNEQKINTLLLKKKL
ncbi:hypothetical protein BKN14_03160 [Candidatus Gracilibacteria bacterium HOT-871]|nr:hypothetical protein BKN14_03160 [Candidatus Gracilibacteria bacterium HOT-871]